MSDAALDAVRMAGNTMTDRTDPQRRRSVYFFVAFLALLAILAWWLLGPETSFNDEPVAPDTTLSEVETGTDLSETVTDGSEMETEPPKEPESAIEAPVLPPGDLQRPTLDVVRVDANGNSLVAGQAEPGSTVIVLLDGEEVSRAEVGPDGGFVAMTTLPLTQTQRLVSLVMEMEGRERLESEAIVIIEPDLTAERDQQDSSEVTFSETDTDVGSAESDGNENAEPERSDTDAIEVSTPLGEEVASSVDRTVSLSSLPDDLNGLETVSPSRIDPTAPMEIMREETGSVGHALGEAVGRNDSDSISGDSLRSNPRDDLFSIVQPGRDEGGQVGVDPVLPANTAISESESEVAEIVSGGAVGETSLDVSLNPPIKEDRSAIALPGRSDAIRIGSTPRLEDTKKPRIASLPGQARTPPTVLIADGTGIRVLQPGGDTPSGAQTVAIDTISYDENGEVVLGGRGTVGRSVRIYLDNRAIESSSIGADGQWIAPLTNVDSGVFALRVDEIDSLGQVTSRMEIPFKREDREVLAELHDQRPQVGARIKVITVQRGNTLWGIARQKYGEGLLYVRVFEANRARIRDPDLIYPGQIFAIPE